ncbi:MAG: polyprenyl synthetase family protein [Deltaproteobacteria bacterium]|nr:polyprenyl synthetase family protein [Deltaproteobacteria bacterium]
MKEHIEALMAHEAFSPFAAEMIRYQMSTGGKRIRPTLAVMTAEAFGGSATSCLPFAATVELIHNASLVHDDIQDHDRTRRGRPSAWVAFSTEQAINLGDLLFVLGFEPFNRMDIPDSLKLNVMRLTIRAIGELVDGQVYEFVLKERDMVTEEDYFRLVSGKTGSLFRLAYCGGYALADDGDRHAGDIRTMGEHMGGLFQLRDDLLDALGLKEGRPAGSDVAEGKIAFPAAHYMSTARDRDRERLLAVLRLPRDETPAAAVDEVLQRYRDAGSMRAAFQQYAQRREAILALSCLKENGDLRSRMREILEELEPPIKEKQL